MTDLDMEGDDDLDLEKPKRKTLKLSDVKERKQTAIGILIDAAADKDELHSLMRELHELFGKDESKTTNWMREWFDKSNVPQQRGNNIPMAELMGIFNEER